MGAVAERKVPWRRGHPSALQLAHPPTADKYVDVVTKGPEDAATTMGRTRDEPSGKKAYMGGLLTWRKVTTEAAGCTRAPS